MQNVKLYLKYLFNDKVNHKQNKWYKLTFFWIRRMVICCDQKSTMKKKKKKRKECELYMFAEGSLRTGLNALQHVRRVDHTFRLL
jgi:hypothetical protein